MSSYYEILYSETNGDGVSIFDPNAKEMSLINPKAEIELNAAGSLQFTMPPNHIYYDLLQPYKGVVIVKEDGETIWHGRPTIPTVDFFNQKTWYCEGALAYLNDSVQSNDEVDEKTTLEILQKIINRHNSQVKSDREFSIGTVTVDYDTDEYRQFDFETSFDALKEFVLNTDGGYFLVTRGANGENILNWYESMPYSTNQEIMFAINMTDLSQYLDFDTFCTGVLAIGGQVKKEKESEDDPDEYETLHLDSVVWADSEVRNAYGDIVKAVRWDTVTKKAKLETKAQKYVTKHQYANMRIECDALDLHPLNSSYTKFKVGQMVRCVSANHGVDVNLPLSKIVIELDTGEKEVSLGTPEKRSLTNIKKQVDDNKKKTEKKSDKSKTGGGGTSYIYPTSNYRIWVGTLGQYRALGNTLDNETIYMIRTGGH